MVGRRGRMRNDLVEVMIATAAPATTTTSSGPAMVTAHFDLRGLEARQDGVFPPEIVAPSVSDGRSIDAATDRIILDESPTTAVQQPTRAQEPAPITPTVTPPSQSTTASENAEGGGSGMSTAAIAGIAMGVLAGLLAIFVIIWLVVNMRRKKMARQRQQLEDDEKIHGPFTDQAAARTAPSPAPRLSLRPVTQLWPNLSPNGHPERRTSRGVNLNLDPVSSASPTNSLSPLNRPRGGGSAWERPTLNSTTPDGPRPGTGGSVHSLNPFHDSHSVNDEPVSPVSTVNIEAAFATPADSTPEPVSPIDRDEQPDFGAGSASHLSRKTSVRKDLPKPLDLTRGPSPLFPVPPSPSGTEYSMHSMAPGQRPGPSVSAAEIAADGGPSQSTVHRVQLDFKPTLPDELGLHVGQLVRLLHEYDDGWALCIRLDRSHQGVVPRTCLSTRPVKPRPAQGGGRLPVNPSYHQGPAVPSKDAGYNPQSQQRGPGRPNPSSRPHSPISGFPAVPYGGGRADTRSASPGSFYSQGGNGSAASPHFFDAPTGLSPAPGQAY
ncbi:hypothetical protein QBC35DRAFT_208303 [Podospora australis]|uniref:SH3 domain-containing protein n=1 Tax=Podospora australis TaxID=1536484 RepID=A0AAN7AJW3_9PEZI|nr:hypothetical protein QBC35DRAFT_208303 [Podospora australis]